MSHVSQLCQTLLFYVFCVSCVSAQAVFARGISAVWENYICVGEYLLNVGIFKMWCQK